MSSTMAAVIPLHGVACISLAVGNGTDCQGQSCQGDTRRTDSSHGNAPRVDERIQSPAGTPTDATALEYAWNMRKYASEFSPTVRIAKSGNHRKMTNVLNLLYGRFQRAVAGDRSW